MSVVTPLDVYSVRIPTELKHVLLSHDDIKISLTTFCELDKLSTILPLEDVFYLIYEQTTDKGYVDFISKTKLYSFLQHPANINWMLGVKEQYDAYIRKREDGLKVKQNDVQSFLTTPVNESHEVRYSEYSKLGLIVSFTPIDDETDVTEVVGNKYRFNLDLLNTLIKHVGYDELRKHPAMCYLLTIA